MSLIKKAGLDDKIEKSIIVEDNYLIKKIVGYGSTCTVYKSHFYQNGNPKCPNLKHQENKYQVVAIKNIR